MSEANDNAAPSDSVNAPTAQIQSVTVTADASVMGTITAGGQPQNTTTFQNTTTVERTSD